MVINKYFLKQIYFQFFMKRTFTYKFNRFIDEIRLLCRPATIMYTVDKAMALGPKTTYSVFYCILNKNLST